MTTVDKDTNVPCKLCGMKPEYRIDPYTGYREYTGDWDNEFKMADGPWTSLYGGVTSDGRIRLTATGDGRADYFPKYCPECGRRLEDCEDA